MNFGKSHLHPCEHRSSLLSPVCRPPVDSASGMLFHKFCIRYTAFHLLQDKKSHADRPSSRWPIWGRHLCRPGIRCNDDDPEGLVICCSFIFLHSSAVLLRHQLFFFISAVFLRHQLFFFLSAFSPSSAALLHISFFSTSSAYAYL